MAFLNDQTEPRLAKPPAPPPDHKANAEKLLLAANDGAKSLKALFFWYVGALAYAIISVAGISDEQLLKQTPLKLPILSVDIPLVAYFAVLPLVVLLVHLELLVQFALLSNKINKLASGLNHVGAEAPAFRLRLENFMLSHLLAGRHQSILHILLFLLIYAALVLLPQFTLLMIQAQFLAYHSEAMMWWHRLLMLADAGILLYFWPNLFHSQDMKAGDWLTLMLFRVLPRVALCLLLMFSLYALLAWFYWPMMEIVAVLDGLMIIAIILSLRAERWRRVRFRLHVAGGWIAQHVLPPLCLLAALALFVALDRYIFARLGWSTTFPWVALLIVVAMLAIAWFRDRSYSPRAFYQRLARWTRRNHDHGLLRDAPAMTVFGVQCVLVLTASILVLAVPANTERTYNLDQVCAGLAPDRGSALHWLLSPAVSRPDFARQRVSTEEPAGVSTAWCEDNWQDELAGDSRDGHASLPALLLSSAGKKRVLVLGETILVNHALSPEQREKLRKGDADTRSGIEPIDMRARNVAGLQADDAVVPRLRADDRTNLTRASLVEAQLQEANLQGADLSEAMLSDADLRGANLRDAVLINANLAGAALIGADLDDTLLYGSVLDGAQMQGVALRYTEFGGSSLLRTNLVGAYQTEVDDAPSSFAGTAMQLVDLRGASLGRADFSGAWMVWVELQGTDLQVAKFDNAVLVDPQTGALSPDLASLMVDMADAGPLYKMAVARFKHLATGSARTQWPQVKSPVQCLLILTEDPGEGRPMPNCAFAFETHRGAPRLPEARVPTAELWQNFWGAQFDAPCAKGNSALAKSRLAATFPVLEEITFAEPEVQGGMADGAVAVLAERCREELPRSFVAAEHQRLVDEIGPADSSDIRPTTLLQAERFFAAWLDAIDQAEAAAQQK